MIGLQKVNYWSAFRTVCNIVFMRGTKTYIELSSSSKYLYRPISGFSHMYSVSAVLI